MTDTVRTIATLQALLADNTTGNISPQDIRDMLVSVASPLLALYEPGWKDIVMPLNGAGVPAASSPDLIPFGPSGLREEFRFAVNDYCFVGPIHINHDCKPSGDIYLHVHWSTNGTNVQPVKWELQVMRARGHNQENFAAPTTISVEQAAAGSAWRHMVAEVAVDSKFIMTEPDELFLVTLRRVTNGGTDNTDNVFGLCVDGHYQSDRQSTVNKAPNFYG
jgi:hypothetical protein